MQILLLILLTLPLWSAPTENITEARKSVEALLQTLTPKDIKGALKKTDFTMAGCERQKINWMNVLTMKETVTLKYKFGKDCDIEGNITPKPLFPFPAKFKLRNLNGHDEVESTNKITASLEAKPIMFLEVRSGVLKGKKGDIKFEADYQVRINPLSPNNPIQENLGGEMRIQEIYGKKVSIKEKIKVK